MNLSKEQQKLFDEHEIYVYSTIKRRFNNPEFHETHGLSPDEIKQFGLLGLVKACKTYDESKNTAFRSFAISNIIWSINTLSRQNSLNVVDYQSFDLLDKTSLDRELPINDSVAETLYDVIESEEEGYEEVEYNDILSTVLKALPKHVADVVQLRAEGYTYEEIGEKFGVTQQAIRQRLMGRRDEITALITN